MSSVCSIGFIVDDLLAMFNGEMGSKNGHCWLEESSTHACNTYVSTYVGTHCGMLYTNVMNSVLLTIYSSYSASLYVYTPFKFFHQPFLLYLHC